MKDTLKIVKSLEEFGLLIKSVSRIENEAKLQIRGFLVLILATSGALPVGKGIIRSGEGTIRADQDF